MNFLLRYNLLPEFQPACRKRHSMVSAVLTDDRDILLQWLSITFDANDLALPWLQSYLEGWTQSINTPCSWVVCSSTRFVYSTSRVGRWANPIFSLWCWHRQAHNNFCIEPSLLCHWYPVIYFLQLGWQSNIERHDKTMHWCYCLSNGFESLEIKSSQDRVHVMLYIDHLVYRMVPYRSLHLSGTLVPFSTVRWR